MLLVGRAASPPPGRQVARLALVERLGEATVGPRRHPAFVRAVQAPSSPERRCRIEQQRREIRLHRHSKEGLEPGESQGTPFLRETNPSPGAEQIRQIGRADLKELVAPVPVERHMGSDGPAAARQRPAEILVRVCVGLVSMDRTRTGVIDERNVPDVDPVNRHIPVSSNRRNELVLTAPVSRRIADGNGMELLRIATVLKCVLSRSEDRSRVPPAAHPHAGDAAGAQPLVHRASQ